MTLDVAIATYMPEGIKRVEKMLSTLPETEGINYIVSWQQHQEAQVPESLQQRPDVYIYRFEEKGLSRNRNNALVHCKGDLIYFADDDLILTLEAFETIKQRFEEYRDTQVATFKMKEKGTKIYPEEITELKFYLPKGYNIGACQIAIRKEVSNKLKFNEDFGLGSGKYEVGEDELFHLEARKMGLKCRFFPDIVASHPHPATGKREIKDPRVIQGFGVLILKSFPKTFLLRLPIKAHRLYKNKQYNFWGSLYHLFVGTFKDNNSSLVSL